MHSQPGKGRLAGRKGPAAPLVEILAERAQQCAHQEEKLWFLDEEERPSEATGDIQPSDGASSFPTHNLLSLGSRRQYSVHPGPDGARRIS